MHHVVIISGAGSGIGRATALAFARRNASTTQRSLRSSRRARRHIARCCPDTKSSIGRACFQPISARILISCAAAAAPPCRSTGIDSDCQAFSGGAKVTIIRPSTATSRALAKNSVAIIWPGCPKHRRLEHAEPRQSMLSGAARTRSCSFARCGGFGLWG